MELAEAINVVESVLRQAIRQALGTSWTNDLDVAQLEERRTEEAKRRHGAVVDDDLSLTPISMSF